MQRQAFVQDPAKSGKAHAELPPRGRSRHPPLGAWPGGSSGAAGAKKPSLTPPWAPGAASAAEAGGPSPARRSPQLSPGLRPSSGLPATPAPLPGLPAALRLPCRPSRAGEVVSLGSPPRRSHRRRQCSGAARRRRGGRESYRRRCRSARCAPTGQAFAAWPERLDPAASRARHAGWPRLRRSRAVLAWAATPLQAPLERLRLPPLAPPPPPPRPLRAQPGSSGRDPPESGTARRPALRPRPPPEEAASHPRGRPARPGPPPRGPPATTRRPAADRTAGRRPSAQARAPPLPGPARGDAAFPTRRAPAGRRLGVQGLGGRRGAGGAQGSGGAGVGAQGPGRRAQGSSAGPGAQGLGAQGPGGRRGSK